MNGRITKLYNLVLGPGNTTEAGTLVIVQFECIYSGQTSITLDAVGLTNETQYLDVTTVTCTVTIT